MRPEFVLKETATSRVTLERGDAGWFVVRRCGGRPLAPRAEMAHPNVQPTSRDGVARYVPGHPLDRLPLGRREAGRVFLWTVQMLDALAYLHGQGITLGGFEPADVVVSGDHACLVDLGLSGPCGVTAFTAPEKGQAAAGDLFSAGMIAFWLLTGTTVAVTSLASQSELWKTLQAAHPEIPRDQATALLSLLELYPNTRPASAVEARRALERWAETPQGDTSLLTRDDNPAPWLGPEARITPPPQPAAEKPKAAAPLRSRLLPENPRAEMASVMRQLAVMTASGIMIARSLDLLVRTSETASVRHALVQARTAVLDGHALSEGLAKSPKLFSSMIVSLIQAGEQSGRLDEVLRRVADMAERDLRLYQKVKSALSYPMLIFALCLSMVVLVPTFLLKGTFEMLANLGGHVPPVTAVLMAASALLGKPVTWVVIVGGLVALTYGYAAAMRSEANRLLRDRFLLKLWLVGPTYQYMLCVSFSLALETMYASGIPILHALKTAGRAGGSLVFEQAMARAAEEVAAGSTLHEAIERTHLFPRTFINLLSAGEKSGNVDRMLRHIVMMAEGEVEHRLEMAVAALEPFMLWCMGCCVGGIVVAALGPMVNVIERLGF